MKYFSKLSFSKKLIFILIASQVMFLGILVVSGIYFVNNTIEEQFNRRIQSYSLQFESSIKTAMISSDLGTLKSVGQQAILLPDLQSFKIYLSNTLVVDENNILNKNSKYKVIVNEIYASKQRLGQLIYSVSLEKVESNKRNIYLILMLICLFEFLFAIALALKIGQYISKRTNYLIHGINQYANGDFNFQYIEASDDEFGFVAKSFNEMTIKMSELRSQNIHNSKMAALGEMAGGIAHEINNPLTIISGLSMRMFNELKNGNVDVNKMIFSLDRIQITTKRIARIVKGLKSFSRNAEDDPFILTEFSKILEESLSLCIDRFKSKNVELYIENRLNVLTKILCREAQISQVIINLLGNSLDAVEGYLNPWVKLESYAEKFKIFIVITDSGNGIRHEIIDKIMQPFYTTKEVGKGTGLGLSISKGIIEGHGGTFYYDEKCKNTRFVIILPMKFIHKKNSTNSVKMQSLSSYGLTNKGRKLNLMI